MIKQKLINKRKEKGISQEDMSTQLGIEQSQYSRRESGTVQITKSEWSKIAKILNIPFEEIYEPHDGVYVLKNENGDTINHNNYLSQSEYAFETLKKYIHKLEHDNKRLNLEIERLRKSK
jgi:transcriptional regulator with XRE-family HTH domain